MEESNDHVIDIVNPCYPIVTSITEKMESLRPLTSECCIYRVPHRLRRVEEAAYVPKVVSIGPLHHGRKDLKMMEEKKMRYLNDFLKRTKLSLWHCAETVKKAEARLRSCYEETLEFDSQEFVKIILVDAIFVIETLLRCQYSKLRHKNDRMFSPWILPDVKTEFLLLENQLPFFILEDLWPYQNNESISLIHCCYHFFTSAVYFKGREECRNKLIIDKNKPEHLVDLLRKFYVPLNLQVGGHLKTVRTPSATELHQAGVKLKVGSPINLLEICFKKGILEIPKLVIADRTDSILRNLVAYEQCHDCKGNYLSDYITLIDSFVDTAKDVDLLVKKGIFENWLGDSSEVATLINKLGVGVSTNPRNFYFANVCKDLNSYCKTSWHHWKATLKQDYFNTPWASISVAAAFLLIMLTIIQTTCSIISTINGG